MKTMNDKFDIDNIDLEEQLEERLLEEEELALEEELERQEAELESEAELNYKKARAVLNAKNLNSDLSITCENYRTKYTFTKDNIEYIGYVIHKMDKNNFIFNVKETNNPDAKYKLKKFDITKIRLVSK